MSAGSADIGEYHGIHLGIVRDNTGPRNTCRVHVPPWHDDDVATEDLPWAEYCGPMGHAEGQKKIPPIGATVWVMFRNAFLEYPVMLGMSFQELDTNRGTKITAVDGDHRTMASGLHETVSGSLRVQNEGPEVHLTKGDTIEQHGSMNFVVIDGIKYTFGYEEKNVQGSSTERVGGSKIIKITGSQKMDVVGSRDETVGGDQRSFVMGQYIVKAANALGSPLTPGIDLQTINSMFSMAAKTVIGIEGASIMLDPTGLTTAIQSLVSLTLDAGVMIRLGKFATQPIALAGHWHISPFLGLPTSPAVPVPGVGISSKVLSE